MLSRYLTAKTVLFFGAALFSLQALSAPSSPQAMPASMQYFDEQREYSINTGNQILLEALAEEFGFASAIKPKFLGSDFILFSLNFESVIFVSANRRVNPEYVGKGFNHKDGVLFQLESHHQQLAVFFFNIDASLRNKIISRFQNTDHMASLFDVFVPKANAGEVAETTAKAKSLARETGDSFYNCYVNGIVVDGLYGTYKTVIVKPIESTVAYAKSLSRNKSVSEWWSKEVASTKEVGRKIKNIPTTIANSARNSTTEQRQRFACSFISPSAVAGTAAKVGKAAAAPLRGVTTQIARATGKEAAIRGGVRAVAQSDLELVLERLSSHSGSLDSFKTQIARERTLSEIDPQDLNRLIEEANQQLTKIRSSYGSLLEQVPSDKPKVLSLIAEAENKGIPESRIKNAMRDGLKCK